MFLDTFNNKYYDRGASLFKEILWLIISGVIFSSWLPGSQWRVGILRLFGAQVGCKVIIKPYVKIKFPWKLALGDHCWIGEDVWIDNLAFVTIRDHVCISQGAYLCTGSHDWSKRSFDLVVKPIIVNNHAWICSYSKISPGVVVGEGAILSFCSVALKSLEPWTIYHGMPAVSFKARSH